MTAAPDQQTKWIYRGDMYDKLPEELLWREQDQLEPEDALLQRKGLVKATVSSQGTEVVWPLFAANWASLFRVLEWLPTAPAPFKLKYFIVGWAEESFATHVEAAERLSQLIAKSDVHLTTRTFVKDIDPAAFPIPDILHDALLDGTTDPDLSVDCVFDDLAGRFKVTRIGKRSEIARFWGMNPVSFPCRTGNSYDQIISQAYKQVIKMREPHYDHVCAAMITPENETVWFGYQRVVLPQLFPDRTPGVSILSKQSEVDIKFV